MAAIKTLCLTSLFLIVSRISALQTGNDNKTACESSNVTIDFIFNIGNDSFADRSWYKNSVIPGNKIARVISAGSLTVESQYSGRIALNGSGSIILYNVTKTDSGSYLFIIVTDIFPEYGTATTTVNVYVNPNASCMPKIEKDSADNFTCTISDACPGKDSIQAKWEDGSVGVFKCPSATKNTKYKCCAKGDPVTYCSSGDLCTDIECKGSDKTNCKLELGCGVGLGFGIPCVITSIAIGISMYTSQSKVSDGKRKPKETDGKHKPKETDGKHKPKETDGKHKPKETGYKDAYFIGLVHGVGIGVTFQVGWIIIASLICTGTTSCKLELGLGLGLGSGIPWAITIIIAVFFLFSSEDNPSRVEKGKGMLTGSLSTTVISIIVVYLIYDKLKPEQTGIKPDDNPGTPDDKNTEVCLELTVTISKTTNSGPHKVEQNTISEQTNYRQQPLPPVDTEFENTPYRPLPQPPQKGEIKDRNLRGISATIDDTPGLANETPRNKLPPLPIEPKKKRKKRQKKDQMNEETPEEETTLRVN